MEAVDGVPLVGFNQQHVGLHHAAQGAVGQHRGGDALNLVGAFLVVHHGFSRRAQNGGNHLHGGGLAVGAGDGDHQRGQRHLTQNVGADPQRVLAGQGAAAPHQLSHKAARLAYQDGKKLFHGSELSSFSEKSRNSAMARTGAPSASINFIGRAKNIMSFRPTTFFRHRLSTITSPPPSSVL